MAERAALVQGPAPTAAAAFPAPVAAAVWRAELGGCLRKRVGLDVVHTKALRPGCQRGGTGARQPEAGQRCTGQRPAALLDHAQHIGACVGPRAVLPQQPLQLQRLLQVCAHMPQHHTSHARTCPHGTALTDAPSMRVLQPSAWYCCVLYTLSMAPIVFKNSGGYRALVSMHDAA